MNKVEEKLGLKPAYAIALFAIIALNILWLICRAISFTGTISVQTCVPILVLIAAMYYALFGYKKLHGNLMRYMILFHVASEAVLLISNTSRQPAYLNAVNLAIIILSTYMAGRLNKFKQNIVISIIILVLQCVNIYYFVNLAVLSNSLTFVRFFKSIGPVSIWLAISGSYIIRYQLHKDAGIEDE